MKNCIIIFFSLFIFCESWAQATHSIVEKETLEITIESEKKLITKRSARIKIQHANTYYDYLRAPYDNTSQITKIVARIYDKNQELLKTYKKKDASDHSYYDGFSVAADERYLYLPLEHHEYPYYVEYEVHTVQNKLVDLMLSQVIVHYDELIKEYNLCIENKSDVDLGVHFTNIEEGRILRSQEDNITRYKLRDLGVYRREPVSPSHYDILPRIDFSVSHITWEKYQGQSSTWEEFGTYIAKVNDDRQELPEDLKAELRLLTEGLTTKQTVHRVYRYLQDNMRYVSVQLGIGGWQSFSCQYVHKNKFGDCKALSNYMISCLAYLGIDAHYTIINATDFFDHPDDYFSMGFNHVIVYVPETDEWYECTSKIQPPGYLGQDNYDKEVLRIVDGTGVKSKTPPWPHTNNTISREVQISLEPSGDAAIDMSYVGQGGPHEYWRGFEYVLSESEKKEAIQEQFTQTSSQITDYSVSCSKDKPTAKVVTSLRSEKYASKSGTRLFVPLNKFFAAKKNISQNIARQFPVQIRHGYISEISSIVKIPKGYEIENMDKSTSLESPYGTITTTIEQSEDSILYKRRFECKPIFAPVEEYPAVRDFFVKVQKIDSPMLVLKEKKT